MTNTSEEKRLVEKIRYIMSFFKEMTQEEIERCIYTACRAPGTKTPFLPPYEVLGQQLRTPEEQARGPTPTIKGIDLRTGRK